MSFVGIIDRVEDKQAFIIVEDSMFEITVPIHIIKENQYKIGDTVVVNIYDNELNLSINVS